MFTYISRRRALIGGVSLVTLAASATVAWHQLRAPTCAPGYELNDPVNVALKHRESVSADLAEFLHEQFGKQACFSQALNQPMEVRERDEQEGGYPQFPGQLHAITSASLPTILDLRQKARESQAKVANASGSWIPYGKGAVVSDAAVSTSGFGPLGIGSANGLVANLEYDSVNKRMFAAVSAGGVWMSEAAGGDLSTLGDSWTDISGDLPTQSLAHVSWSSANGGTLLALTGENTLDGGAFPSYGAFWSTDLGKHWKQSKGMDAVIGGSAHRMAVDQSNPNIVYAATGRGLYRSDDAGQSFVNVNLPTGPCKGVTDISSECYLSNVVTDVVVQTPGGLGRSVTCGADGCPVVAAVGWPYAQRKFGNGHIEAPYNGIYKSITGKVDSFKEIGVALPDGTTTAYAPNSATPIGFAPKSQVGHVRLGAAYGPNQDHNFLYANVHDAKLQNGAIAAIDLDDPVGINAACVGNITPKDPSGLLCKTLNFALHPTAFNGIYVSPDFGDTWVRLADEIETTYNPAAGSALNPAYIALAGYGPGIQAFYNNWVAVDPTGADVLPAPLLGLPAGIPVPTRVAFGLEEVWMSRVPTPLGGKPGTQIGPLSDFEVVGDYFAGTACYGLSLNLPLCPQQPTALMQHTTTHPDQHAGLFVPDGSGGVYLFAANDGGIYKSHSSGPSDPFNNTKWGNGITNGMNTLILYGIGVAKDGTVVGGLQDNGSIKIEPGDDGHGGRILSVGGGDGVYSQIDPEYKNSEPDAGPGFYQSTPGLAISTSSDGGKTFTGIAPGAKAGVAHFTSPYMIDPMNSGHIVAVGSKVTESVDGFSWSDPVYDLNDSIVDPDHDIAGIPHQSRLRALDVQGKAVYVGWCGPCLLVAAPGAQFQRGLATNVSATKGAPTADIDTQFDEYKATWHEAGKKGLPNRYIAAVEIDPKDAKTVYVGLGNYSTARYLRPGSFDDNNSNLAPGSHIYKSTDAGESFKDISHGKLPDVFVTSILVVGNQIIAGTDVGAFISSDLNGTDWALMGNLPPIAVSQLVQDPSNPKRVFAATMGRGVYTYDLGGKDAVIVTSSRQGKGLLLGALPPALLVLFGFAAFARRRRH